ncbi:MAG: hypothetical protein HY288_19090 [Planctomycetia bacterium]|nr:hypothetical protein [Planctomycetia bacterium]
MTWGSVLLVAAGLYVLLWMGRRACGRSSRIHPLTVLGVAVIIGGLAVFGGRSATHLAHVHLDDSVPAEERLNDNEVSAHQKSPLLWRSESERLSTIGVGLDQMSAKKWVLISLGTVLVITGALLAGRGRARPVALKAFTVLGLAAAAFALISFVTSVPRHTWDNGDRIVKNDRTTVIGVDSRSDDEPPAPAPPKKPKRLTRAKRPTSRPDRRESTEELIAKMPPRTGEIPVADELAKGAAKTESTSVVVNPPSPAAAEPAPVPGLTAAEPPKAPEPAAAVEAVKAAEETQPAEQVPPRVPDKTPGTTNVSQPAKNPSPATSPEPAAAPAAAVSKPAVEVSPPATSPGSASNRSAAERPAWVDAPGKLIDSVYRVSINSGPFVTVPECQRSLDVRMKHTADQYIDDYLGEGASAVVDIPLVYLRNHVYKAAFNEVIQSESVGAMQQIHALLEFDDDARADFHRRWHSAIVGRRLWHVAASTGLILALLATLYGYLRLDLRTGGTHKGQLQLAAALVALIVTAGALLVQSKLPF